MICRSCGAAVPAGSGAFCSHCGRAVAGESTSLPTAVVLADKGVPWPATVPAPAPPALDPARLPAPPSEHAARFAMVRRDPGYDAAMTAQVAAPKRAQVVSLLTSLGFMLFGGVFAVGWFGFGGPLEMMLLGAIIMTMFMGTAGAWTLRAWKALAAPQDRHLACVRSRETLAMPQGSGDGGPAQAMVFSQRVTLELEDGRRLSLGGDDAVVGTLVEEDVGVAYVKGDRLIGFRRLAG